MTLTQKLTQNLEELKDIMAQRRERIKELQDEINKIEQENSALEDAVATLLKDF